MTRNELNQIYNLNKELKMWQKELERLQCQSFIKGQEITGMPFGSGTTDKVGRLASEIVNYKTCIEGILARIEIERGKVMKYIETIKDSDDRQIIYYKCVSNLNWHQTARNMGEGYTADMVKQRFYRRLKKDNIN